MGFTGMTASSTGVPGAARRFLAKHRGTMAWWVGTIVLLLGLRASVADHYRVPSGSMLPTVEVGDRVLVNSWPMACACR